MTPDLKVRLERVEAAVQNTKPILANHNFPKSRRTMVVIAIISQMYEHHEAMLLLLMHDKIGSALALGRSVFEGVCRGMWLDACATDAEVDRFVEKDEIRVSMGDMSKAMVINYLTHPKL